MARSRTQGSLSIVGVFWKKRANPISETAASGEPGVLVQEFLRGQNLEQIGRVDEAIALYERAVAGGFDASGPYDRLLTIYQQRRMHLDVIRVAQACLGSVRTYPARKLFYEELLAKAKEALGD